MKKLGVKVKILNPDAIIPKYQTEEAAGFDLHSIEEKTVKNSSSITFRNIST